jgi:hypothetical protein
VRESGVSIYKAKKEATMIRDITMRVLLCTLALAGSMSAQPCLIVKHASAARQAFVSGANWQYVDGEFPTGMKWKSNITDRNIRKIKELGGKVVVVNQNYSSVDLEAAKKQCADTEPSK